MTLSEKIRALRLEHGWTQLQLAKQAGLDRGYIANLEGTRAIKRPSAEALLKLAKAFNVKPEELYEAAGYIKESTNTFTRPETPEEILDRLKLATPVSIPIYPEFPFHAGHGVEPVDYIYRARLTMANKEIEAYIVHGTCLEPKIANGDIIIVDRNGTIDNGDIVACLIDNEFHVLRIRKVADELWLESNHGKFKFEQCQYAAPVIECIRRLK